VQSSNSSPVTQDSPAIQDIVIASKLNKEGKTATGEFGHPENHGGKPADPNEKPEAVIERLSNAIIDLANDAAAQHRASFCQNGTNTLRDDAKNRMTRMTTNEFFFYTQKPLTIEQFQALMKDVGEMAASQPENLHLVLGSFAVRTPDNKVMNVVPHIECGPTPKINLIVKNHPSVIDPKYQEPYISKVDNISGLKIQINGNDVPFSFNNVLECKTAGGTPFYSCVDICADHCFRDVFNLWIAFVCIARATGMENFIFL